jgi:hypothetical protein
MEWNSTPPEQTDARQCSVECALTGTRQPIPIVQVPWPIDADADANLFRKQKVAPGIVDQHSIGLK